MTRPFGTHRNIDADAEITAVVDAIDGWVATHVARERSAPMHTHSLGQVISHIAETYVQAWWMVLHCADVDVGHQAWSRLAEAREGYTALLAEIQNGHRQLPLGWQGVRSPSR
ncbi:hypothetical protein [Nocardia nepalensis]|uniref:hypothetical protein n=1 Tax=Nocardia nepalensis TaxID=3375448 RepID=UPI003B681C3F